MFIVLTRIRDEVSSPSSNLSVYVNPIHICYMHSYSFKWAEKYTALVMRGGKIIYVHESPKVISELSEHLAQDLGGGYLMRISRPGKDGSSWAWMEKRVGGERVGSRRKYQSGAWNEAVRYFENEVAKLLADQEDGGKPQTA